MGILAEFGIWSEFKITYIYLQNNKDLRIIYELFSLLKYIKIYTIIII